MSRQWAQEGDPGWVPGSLFHPGPLAFVGIWGQLIDGRFLSVSFCYSSKTEINNEQNFKKELMFCLEEEKY